MIRDLLDEVRETVIADATLSPTREIVYTHIATDEAVTLNSYVGAGQFNKEEKDTLDNRQSFGGLNLEVPPKANDTVLYDSRLYSVERYTKMGTLYIVYCEQKRQRGRGRR